MKYRFLHIENQEVIYDPNLWALWPNRKAGLFGHPHPLDEWFMTLQFRIVNAFGTSEASRKAMVHLSKISFFVSVNKPALRR